MLVILILFWLSWSEADDNELLVGFSETTYFICQAEDSTSECRFKVHRGLVKNIDGDSYWEVNEPGYVLDSLVLFQPTKYSVISRGWPEYYAFLKLRLDQATCPDTSALLGVFEIKNISSDMVRFCDSIYVRDIYELEDSLYIFKNDYGDYKAVFYTLRDDFIDTTQQVLFRYWAAGNYEVYIDYFKVYCQYGAEIVEDQIYDQLIFEYLIRSGFNGGNLSWNFRDELQPSSYLVYDHLDSLINSAIEYHIYMQLDHPPDRRDEAQ